MQTRPTPAASATYRAGTIKRQRATDAEMAARDAFLIDYAVRHAPVTALQRIEEEECATLRRLLETIE